MEMDIIHLGSLEEGRLRGESSKLASAFATTRRLLRVGVRTFGCKEMLHDSPADNTGLLNGPDKEQNTSDTTFQSMLWLAAKLQSRSIT